MKTLNMKIIFILNSLVYFLLLYKGWSYLFSEVIPSTPLITLIGIVGIFIILVPLSLFITHKIFEYVRENYKTYNIKH